LRGSLSGADTAASALLGAMPTIITGGAGGARSGSAACPAGGRFRRWWNLLLNGARVEG